MIGVALGVAALITVLSVMNGFQQELRDRILGMASHATIMERGRNLQDWESIRELALKNPRIEGAAPFVRAQAMLTRDKKVKGALIRGVLPEFEPSVSIVGDRMVEGNLSDLEAGAFHVVLGKELASSLRVGVGDKITLVAPQPSVTPAGILPRLKRFTVSGIYEIGMQEYDGGLALIHMQDAMTLFRQDDGVTGLRLKMDDMFDAPRISRELIKELPGVYGVIDWTQYHANFFRALKMEKIVMLVILTLIVAVAAFNIVSTLVMVVTDKQADIAILRTLGLSPRSVMAVFMVQGTLIGLIGTLLGLVSGILLASNVKQIVQGIEQFFHTKFLSEDVYYITELTADIWPSDVISICAVSFILCVLGTLYPAWRASRTQPAEALRYE